jgi:SAM-dependent methyltransferase
MRFLRNKNKISTYEIKKAYYYFLNRNPETNAVVKDKKERLQNFSELRDEFLNSSEFQLKNWPPLSPTFIGKKPNFSEDPPSRLTEIVADQWSHLGDTNPFWSVLSADEFSGNIDAFQIEKFFRTGEFEVDKLLKAFEYHEIDLPQRLFILELGSGLGRVTKALARYSEYILGLDVSKPHIEIAKKYLSDHTNITFELMDQQTMKTQSTKLFNLFFSIISLQHNPPAIQRRLLENAVKTLQNKGSFVYFQTCCYIENYSYDESLHISLERDFETHALPISVILEILARNNFTIIDLWRDGYQIGINHHSYTFFARN